VRIAVIGSSGQLGYDLCAVLSHPHEVVELTHKEIEVTEFESVQKALAEAKFDFVINTSAFHKLEKVEDNPTLAFSVNAVGPRNLALTCRKLDVPLVHLSTDYVFSGRKHNPYIESDNVDPINIYGISKVAGEMALRSLWHKHFIVRTGSLYGRAGSSGKGSNFVELMLRLASEGKPIKVVNDQKMTPTATLALANQVERLIKTEDYGTYHATCQGSCSWYEFAEEIFRWSSLNPDLTPQSTAQSGSAVKRPTYSVLENANLKHLGIDNMPHWKDSLHRYLSNKKEN